MNYSFAQLEQFAANAGFPAAMQPIMAAIALAESSGNPGAVNPNDNGGRQSSYGLWQISTGTHAAPGPNWSDPATNAALAFQKWQQQGLSAWGTYNSGAYLQYLNGNSSTSGVSTSTLGFPSIDTSGITSAISSTLAPLTGLANSLGAFWNGVKDWLTNPWRIVKLVVGGALLVGVAVALVTGSDAGKTTISMGKKAAEMAALG